MLGSSKHKEKNHTKVITFHERIIFKKSDRHTSAEYLDRYTKIPSNWMTSHMEHTLTTLLNYWTFGYYTCAFKWFNIFPMSAGVTILLYSSVELNTTSFLCFNTVFFSFAKSSFSVIILSFSSLKSVVNIVRKPCKRLKRVSRNKFSSES